MKFHQIFAFITLSIVIGCTSSKPIMVKHLAAITIPADLDSIVLVDRALFAKGRGNKALNVLEGIATGEPILGDKYGVRSCKESLLRILQNHDRLTLMTSAIIELKNENGYRVNTTLPASFLDSICSKNNADGVLALEYFDSDRTTNNNSSSRDVVAHTRWRLYYKDDQSVVDDHRLTTHGTGYVTYTLGVPPRYKAIGIAGALAADIYLRRIVPSDYRETRMYYVSGSREMKLAANYVAADNWQEAKYMWETVLETNVKNSLLKRASYNMALFYEMRGDLDEAMQWINKSLQAGNTNALRYKNILTARIQEQELIYQQMKRE